MISKSFAELSPAQRDAANDAFQALAKAQLGKPERLGTSPRANPAMFHAMGAFCYLAEHLGDLTQRLSDGCEHTNFGFTMVRDKVERGLRYYRNGYGLAREIEGNLRNNYEIYREKPDASLSFPAYRAAFEEGAERYAAAHEALTVYNEAQWLGRACAIALGRRDFDGLGKALKAIEANFLAGQDAWMAWASQVNISSDGEVLPYRPAEPDDELAPSGF